MKRIKRNDRGSALLIALVFLALFSLWLTATMSSAAGGLHIAQTMKVQPSKLYAADGAIEQAIQKVRYAGAKGVEGDTTCGSSFTLNSQTYYVKCQPQAGSGKAALGGSSPTIGILALSNGTAGEYGYIQTGNSVVRLDGGLYSNTRVSFQNGNTCATATDVNCQQLNLCPNNEKTVTDAVTEKNSATVTSLSAGFTDTSTATDVGVPIRGVGIPLGDTITAVTLNTAASIAKQPTQFSVGRTITFRENYPRLQVHCHPPAGTHGKFSAMGSGETCDQTRIVAAQQPLNCEPGIPDPAVGVDPNYQPDQSTFNTTQSVPSCGSGQIVNLSPGKYTDVDALNNLVSSCSKLLWFQSGTYYFDFSSSSNPVWNIGNPNATIVGGAKTWDSRGVITASIQNGKTTVTALSTNTFTTADIGKYINAGYNLPYGTKIVDVPNNKNGKEATISAAAVNAVNSGPFTIGSQDSLCDKTPSGDHAGVEFIFGGTSRVVAGDGKTEICAPVNGSNQQIAVYGAKALQGNMVGQTGCVTTAPYPGAGCAAISTSGPKVVFLVHGTVYMPNAVIDLSLQTVGYQVVSRGIIARVVALGISPSAGFTDPVIFSPDFGSVTGSDRSMVFTACANAPCDSGGVPKLRSLVRIQDHEDAPYQANVSVGYRTTVESWTVLR